MKKKILVFNWKMNPQTKKEALKIFDDLKKVIQKAEKDKKKISYILAPPAIYLDAINLKNKKSKIFLSGQDTFFKTSGSYTGAISTLMIKDLGAKYSIVGHWERRNNFGETNLDVAKKVKTLIDLKMKAIICVGEENRDKKGDFVEVLKKQILEALEKVEIFDLKNIILAYEPGWAIGGGSRKPTMEEVEQSILLIKKILRKKFGEESERIKILYGGSVDLTNSQDLSNIFGLDGFLLGRASLDKNVFQKIILEKIK